MSESAPPEVTVCVCTYRRADLLSKLLNSLLVQETSGVTYEVIVVDNDSIDSARTTVDAAEVREPCVRMRYVHEPRSGISYARNRAVSESAGHLIAFIDDDEVADPLWLANLLKAHSNLAADAVFGPVLPEYPPGTPEWIIQSKFFERPCPQTGSAIDWRTARCGNALVIAKILRSRNPAPFDPRLGQSGGEDTDFFRWAVGRGVRLGWTADAVVHEFVPKSRQSLRYMLERSLRTSTNYWAHEYASRSFLSVFLCAAVGGVAAAMLVAVGMILSPFAPAVSARALSKSMKALGRAIAPFKPMMVGYGSDK